MLHWTAAVLYKADRAVPCVFAPFQSSCCSHSKNESGAVMVHHSLALLFSWPAPNSPFQSGTSSFQQISVGQSVSAQLPEVHQVFPFKTLYKLFLFPPFPPSPHVLPFPLWLFFPPISPCWLVSSPKVTNLSPLLQLFVLQGVTFPLTVWQVSSGLCVFSVPVIVGMEPSRGVKDCVWSWA